MLDFAKSPYRHPEEIADVIGFLAETDQGQIRRDFNVARTSIDADKIVKSIFGNPANSIKLIEYSFIYKTD